MTKDPEPYSVLIRVRSEQAVRDWCLENVPEKHFPTLTVRQTRNSEFVVRAFFRSKHYAALFRLFWDEGHK